MHTFSYIRTTLPHNKVSLYTEYEKNYHYCKVEGFPPPPNTKLEVRLVEAPVLKPDAYTLSVQKVGVFFIMQHLKKHQQSI